MEPYDGPRPTTEAARGNGGCVEQGQGVQGGGLSGSRQHAEQLKARQYAEQSKTQQVNRLAYDQPGSASVRERVYQACNRGDREARLYNRALRCAQLMEAHPEVAELIELLRDF